MKIKVFFCVVVALSLLAPPAFSQTQCDKQAVISAPVSATTEIIAAVPGSTIYVCGFVLSANTASAAQFQSNNSNRTGVIFIPTGGSVAFGGGDAIVIQGAASQNLQLSVGTVPVTGVVVYAQ